MEDTKLVVCRLCLGFTTSDDSQIVDSPLKKILQDILPEINLEISYDPKICQPCNKSVLKCYEFKSSCSRDSIKEEIQAEEAAADLVIETDLQQEKKCDFCFSKINEKAFVEFSVRKEFFNEVLQKCLPGWFQKITKQKSAVPCGTCLDDLKSHFLFIGACLTTEEKIRKYCTTYGTNSKDKVNLFEVAQADLNPIQEYSAESKMGETIVPLKVEPIDIKHEIYEGDFIGHASTNQSDQLTASDGADDLAMVTDDQGPEKCEMPLTSDRSWCYQTIGGRTFLKPGAVMHVFEVSDPMTRHRIDVHHEVPSEVKQPKIEPGLTTFPPNKRSIGTQVNWYDLIATCEIGTQAGTGSVETCSVGVVAKPSVSNKATRCKPKVKDAASSTKALPVGRKRPNILRKPSKKMRK